MTKDRQSAGTRFRVLSRKGSNVYQRVTGNEGPSPFLKRYLKARQKGQPARSVGDEPDKTS